MKKYNIDWFEIESLVNHLCEKINSHDKKYQNILGLQRGGLIPAVMISHTLGIPMVKGDITPDTLIIDDICDSGETLKQIVEKYQTLYNKPFNLDSAVLHYKPHTSCFEPTLWAKRWSNPNWIQYPWEREDSKTIQDYKVKVGEAQ